MTAPVYSPASSVGNVIVSGTTLGANKNSAVPLDLTSVFEGQVTCSMKTGSSVAATAGVKWEAYHRYGSTTTTQSIIATATSVTVASVAGIVVGQRIIIYDATNGGEVVTVSAVNAGTLTLTISATATAHDNGAAVYIIEQTPSITAQPASSTGSYSANTVYSKSLYLPTSQYVLLGTNLDVTNSVTIEVTKDTVSGIN